MAGSDPLGYLYIGILVASILFLLIYVWPATARLWGPFLLAFSIALFFVASYWVAAPAGFNGTDPLPGLSGDVEFFSRWTATAYLGLACALQWVRRWKMSSGQTGYRHWRVVLLMAFAPPILVLPFVWPFDGL